MAKNISYIRQELNRLIHRMGSRMDRAVTASEISDILHVMSDLAEMVDHDCQNSHVPRPSLSRMRP